MRGYIDSNREATVVALYRGGATMDEIGEISGGISRQRVQQILRRNDVHGQNNDGRRLDPLRIIAACRKPGVRNWSMAAIEVGTKDIPSVQRAVEQFGMRSAIERLFAWRRSARHRTKLAEQYRALTMRLGRPPTFKELIPANGVPWWTSFIRIFGSIQRVREAAGVNPKDQRHGRPSQTTCKRGHVLASTRDKWGACVRCRNIRAQNRRASA